MKQYLFLLLAFLVACAESGGSKPATSSSSSEPYKTSTTPAKSAEAAPAPFPIVSHQRLARSALAVRGSRSARPTTFYPW